MASAELPLLTLHDFLHWGGNNKIWCGSRVNDPWNLRANVRKKKSWERGGSSPHYSSSAQPHRTFSSSTMRNFYWWALMMRRRTAENVQTKTKKSLAKMCEKYLFALRDWIKNDFIFQSVLLSSSKRSKSITISPKLIGHTCEKWMKCNQNTDDNCREFDKWQLVILWSIGDRMSATVKNWRKN